MIEFDRQITENEDGTVTLVLTNELVDNVQSRDDAPWVRVPSITIAVLPFGESANYEFPEGSVGRLIDHGIMIKFPTVGDFIVWKLKN